MTLNNRPADGRALVRHNKKRQCDWDVTLSDPKSPSALWAVCGERQRQEINAIRKEVIEGVAVPYLEEIVQTRRGKGGISFERVKAVVAAFSESTSREDQPQPHTHIVVANLGARDDGTKGTIVSRALYKAQGAINAAYVTEFSRLLERHRGLRVERKDQWFEVAGVPQKLCEHWPERSKQIKAAVAERRLASARARETATLDTRPHKGHAPLESLLGGWGEEAQRYGFGQKRCQALFGQRITRGDVLTTCCNVAVSPRPVMPQWRILPCCCNF